MGRCGSPTTAKSTTSPICGVSSKANPTPIVFVRTPTPKLFLARDHFGIKPLYYCERGGRLAFASEVKALLEVPGIEASMNMEALHQYLTFLWVPEPLTMFDGIRKLPAGHYAVWQRGEFEIDQYWD